MARIVLVTGGCRSGKSAYAQGLAESLPPTRLFVATCPVTDEEIRCRIEQHRRARRDGGWETVEEECDLAGVFRKVSGTLRVPNDGTRRVPNTILVDCVTLWINNLMYHAERKGCPFTETEVAGRCREVLDAANACSGTVIFVTNEVGLGVVPENAQARHYRDLIGRANQVLAARTDAVTLLCCGIPVQLKDAPPAPLGEGEGNRRVGQDPGHPRSGSASASPP